MKVVGVCYACRTPVRANEQARVRDRSVGVERLAHAGSCAQMLDVRLNGRTIEGGDVSEVIYDPVVTATIPNTEQVPGMPKRLTLVRMTVSELVASYLGTGDYADPPEPERAASLAITIAGRNIVPEPGEVRH